MGFQIRRATREDCPRLMELIRELAVYERAPEQVTVTLEHFAESGFGPQPVWWAFVATGPEKDDSHAGQKILGFALYYIRYSTWKGQALYLEDILVTQTARGQGIGGKLFERLIEEAKEKKFNRISWQVLEWNESAIIFYKKFKANFDGEWLNGSLSLIQDS